MGKQKRIVVPVEGRDYTRLANGAITVNREFPDLMIPYAKEPIPDYLSLVDHSLKLKKKKYEKLLLSEEHRLNMLVRGKMKDQKRALIIVLQGRDGAGKTGARVRIEAGLDNDAKIFLAICIGAPSEDERAHPHLWRFFTGERMPKFGEVRVFDRSWHERLLVEPVMKFTSPELVQLSYAELRVFEWQLEQQGAIVVKFWMDITYDEQGRRFADRKESKPWKLGDSDTVARDHWDDYTVYANEMIHRTGTTFAPWNLISSEDKRYSRVTALQIINMHLQDALR